jgi:hypothetical protein
MKKLVILIAVLGAAWTTGKAGAETRRDSLLSTLIHKEKVWIGLNTHIGRHQSAALALNYHRSPRLQFGLEYGFANKTMQEFHLNDEFVMHGSWLGLNTELQQPLHRRTKDPALKSSLCIGVHYSRGLSNIITYNSFPREHFDDYIHKEPYRNYRSQLWAFRIGAELRIKEAFQISGGMAAHLISADYHYNEAYQSEERSRHNELPMVVHPKVIDNLLGYYVNLSMPLWKKSVKK